MRALEAALLYPFFLFFRLLPIDWASAMGGWIGRTFGPLVPVTRRARINLQRAFPEKSAPEIATILRDMWDNLGRTFAEYPHVARLRLYDGDGRVEVKGAENIDLLRDDGKPGIFFSLHMGNWEVNALSAAQRGLPVTQIYRAANNPLTDALFRHSRRGGIGGLLRKGRQAARGAIEVLKGGGHLAMLIDQKMNEGIPVPFFGRPAMTAPAAAALAYRYDCPLVPAKTERLRGARFRVTLYPPMKLARTGDAQADIAATMAAINRLFEEWIRASPAQWLWLHRRWPD